MRVTIRDVAARAGVSAMAVSAVLNGAGGRRVSVSTEKAELIRRAAEELHYHPNHTARVFRTKKTGQVAVVFQKFGRMLFNDNYTMSPYRAQVMTGIMEALFPNDYSLTLCPKVMRESEPNNVFDGRFDGVLWCRPDLSEHAAHRLQEAGLPMVMMHAPPGTVLGIPSFCADNEGAMRRVVAHLTSLGHVRLAYVIDSVSGHSVEGIARYEALRAACARAELPNPDHVVLGSEPSTLAPYAKKSPPHTALVCYNDEIAGYIVNACREMGVSVPAQLSVVGFDSTAICETSRPTITAINQPVQRMAFDATTHLLALIGESESGGQKASARSTVYDCMLDVRQSTGPVRNELS